MAKYFILTLQLMNEFWWDRHSTLFVGKWYIMNSIVLRTLVTITSWKKKNHSATPDPYDRIILLKQERFQKSFWPGQSYILINIKDLKVKKIPIEISTNLSIRDFDVLRMSLVSTAKRIKLPSYNAISIQFTLLRAYFPWIDTSQKMPHNPWPKMYL